MSEARDKTKRTAADSAYDTLLADIVRAGLNYAADLFRIRFGVEFDDDPSLGEYVIRYGAPEHKNGLTVHTADARVAYRIAADLAAGLKSNEACTIHRRDVDTIIGAWRNDGNGVAPVTVDPFKRDASPTDAERAIFDAVSAMHDNAIDSQWPATAPEWSILNRLRAAIGWPKAEPTDNPTVGTKRKILMSADGDGWTVRLVETVVQNRPWYDVIWTKRGVKRAHRNLGTQSLRGAHGSFSRYVKEAHAETGGTIHGSF